MSTPSDGSDGPQSAPAPKSKAPLFVGLGCGCLGLLAFLAAIALVLLLLAGGGLYLLTDPGGSEATAPEPATTATDPDDGAALSISVSEIPESTTLETEDGTSTSEHGKYVGAGLTIENTGTVPISLSPSNIMFYDADGTAYPPDHWEISVPGGEIAPGTTATADVYVDVSEGTEITTLTFTDLAGTGGQEIDFPID